MRLARPIALATVSLALFDCGGAGGVDRRVEDLVTVRRGLYGQVTSQDDVGDARPAYLPGFGVDVFPVPAGTELGAPVAHVASAARGFWQLELAPAEYVVCSTFRRCVRLALGDALRRLDYEESNGPGWSGGTPWP